VYTASAPEATGAESLRARETLKALYGYVRPHRWAVALGLLCALAGAAGGLLQPLATKTLVDRVSSGGTIGTVLLAMTVLQPERRHHRAGNEGTPGDPPPSSIRCDHQKNRTALSVAAGVPVGEWRHSVVVAVR
jgi:hypothetical protein